MPAENYRYYCLDPTGQLHRAEWFQADDDEQAIQLVADKHPSSHCEIWHGDRLVGKVEPKRMSA